MQTFRKFLTNKTLTIEIANSCLVFILMEFFPICQFRGHSNAAISVKVNDLVANASHYFLYPKLTRRYLLHLQQQIWVFIYQTMNSLKWNSVLRVLSLDWFRCTTRTTVNNGWRHVWKYFASCFIKWFRKKKLFWRAFKQQVAPCLEIFRVLFY